MEWTYESRKSRFFLQIENRSIPYSIFGWLEVIKIYTDNININNNNNNNNNKKSLLTYSKQNQGNQTKMDPVTRCVVGRNEPPTLAHHGMIYRETGTAHAH